MNPFDILTEILNSGAAAQQQQQRGGSRGGGSGADILKDILGGGPAPRSGSGGSSGGVQFPGVLREGRGGSGSKIPSEAELEDMLGVGRSAPTQQHAPQSQAPAKPAPTQPVPTHPAPTSQRGGAPQGDIFGQQPQRQAPAQVELSASEQEQMVTLIRAMIYAGKADGRIDANEQQAIVDRIGNTNPETIQFLRKEFASATSVRDFAWSVPLGMEAAVYAASLSTIEIDTQAEIDYLKELAHGLRLQTKVCNQIHQQYGIKPIF
ncbi:MAG: tellurite resistance TerB family protein [Planctomycetes bacterium]|nr:tellurite resistance TerB family protein [Planctomycetota bacterium]